MAVLIKRFHKLIDVIDGAGGDFYRRTTFFFYYLIFFHLDDNTEIKYIQNLCTLPINSRFTFTVLLKVRPWRGQVRQECCSPFSSTYVGHIYWKLYMAIAYKMQVPLLWEPSPQKKIKNQLKKGKKIPLTYVSAASWMHRWHHFSLQPPGKPGYLKSWNVLLTCVCDVTGVFRKRLKPRVC